MKSKFFKHLILTLTICITSTTTLCANDTNDTNEPERASINIGKTTKEEKDFLEKNKPKDHSVPKIPEFILKSETGRFYIALGGYIRPIFGWDLGNNIDNISFVVASIPVPSLKGNRSNFYANPLQSAIDLQIIGLPGTDNQVSGYIKVKFSTPNRAAQLSNLYFIYRGLTFGRTHSFFNAS